MPSKNGFNKPKDHINRAKKATNAAKKNKLHTFQPVPTSIDLYRKSKIDKGFVVTNKKHQLTTMTLSNKKLKKIERNLRHLKNNGIESKIMVDLEAQKQENMNVDEDVTEKVQTLKDQTKSVREALWAVVEDQNSQGIEVDSTGEGTTLGYAGFY